ncbi:MAG: three-Cys-motif partner protein TcmP [Solirubrobacterales bacterium]
MIHTMTNSVLWDLDPHTAAKHRVLRSYLDGWIPVLGKQAQRVGDDDPRLMLVDGFAGPGRYAAGEPGSPLIMLDALLSHQSFKELAGVRFIFFFIEHDEGRVEHLREEVAELGKLPENVSVAIEHGEFEATFSSVIDPIIEEGAHLIPTFAFIDPFGYSSASMSITGRLLDFPRCETLFFLPMTFIHRFVGRTGQEAALTSLFGTDEWRAAIPLQGAARTIYLLELFERQLEQSRGVEYVRSFQLRTRNGRDYRLVFGLGHRKGLEIAKDAMWKVDPLSGTSYTATTESGQEVLFNPGDNVDTWPLLAELRVQFGMKWFTIDQAEHCTLADTPFRSGHLRRLTLQPAEREGKLEVQRPGRGFKNAKMRFCS